MKSQALNWLPFQEVPIDGDFFLVEYESDQAIEQPFIDYILSVYNQENSSDHTQVTDKMVQVLGDDKIQTVDDAKSVARQVYFHRERESVIYNRLIPYLRNYYAQNSNVLINSDELAEYTKTYTQDLKDASQEAGVNFRTYVIDLFNLDQDVLLDEAIENSARTDFIFGLIATDYYQKQGNDLSYETYEQLINQSVLRNRADEIELRDKFSYQDFLTAMPEIYFINDIVEYFTPQVKFKKIND